MKLFLFQSGSKKPLDRGCILVSTKEPELILGERGLADGRWWSIKGPYETLCRNGVSETLGIPEEEMPRVGEYIEIEVKVL